MQIDGDDPIGIDYFAAVCETHIALLRDFVHHGLQLRPFETERHVLRGKPGKGQQTGQCKHKPPYPSPWKPTRKSKYVHK